MSIGDIIQSESYLINIFQILCPISTALLMLLGFASISHYFTLSIERFIRLNCNINMTRAIDEHQFLIISLPWIYAVIWVALPFFGLGSFREIARLDDFCIPEAMRINHKIYVAIVGTFGFLLPTIGCDLLYFKTRRKLRKHESNSLEAGVNARKRKKYIKKFDKMSWTMNLIFCIGRTPYFLCSMYYVSRITFQYIQSV